MKKFLRWMGGWLKIYADNCLSGDKLRVSGDKGALSGDNAALSGDKQ
ncbi:hypothetical protein [Sporosarcina highlanderae]|uniref:Uncharacterized protein n=1 Tax=Sporosarcina highlanderae TaxID=3035916 RepID=A0ABT8JM39_9BACL|nr:hypothetical protein [Sporosarcina highlanderae]MDN4606219.1 hypothetical protein [Sporosarcina highlanderae]